MSKSIKINGEMLDGIFKTIKDFLNEVDISLHEISCEKCGRPAMELVISVPIEIKVVFVIKQAVKVRMFVHDCGCSYMRFSV